LRNPITAIAGRCAARQPIELHPVEEVLTAPA
jgi:hypothetical protein